MSGPQTETQVALEPRQMRIADDTAYLIPMAVFLGLVWVGGHWKSLYVAAYGARTAATGVLLVMFRSHYTKIRWNHWWLGIIVGIIGIFQWIGMQHLLERHFDWFKPGRDFFNPADHFQNAGAFWSFAAVRIFGAVLVVPFMEELFWRDYLWRYISAPNNFKLAAVGERDWKSLLIVSGAFALVHGNWWLTAIVWALLIAVLLITTRSLGACIIAHGVTNLLLAMYVLKYHEYSLW
jgi:CAAX prenyl protease-like protein